MAVILRRGKVLTTLPRALAGRELQPGSGVAVRTTLSRRGFADVVPATSGAEFGWLLPRPSLVQEALSDDRTRELCERLVSPGKMRLEVCSGAELARHALCVAMGVEMEAAADVQGGDKAPVSPTWANVLERLQDERVYMDEFDSLLVLHSMVKKDKFDRRLFSRLVDRIETRYDSMELSVDDRHPVLQLFKHEGSYRSLIDNLPVEHKVRLILLDSVQRDRGTVSRRAPAPQRDTEEAWKTMDPVDMEEKEKQHFFKARLRVMTPRIFPIKVKKMQPGVRLRGLLSLQLLEAIPQAPLPVLAQIAQVTAFPGRVLQGDMEVDFQEALSRRLLSFDAREIQPFAVALASGMALYGGSVAFQAWRRKLLPAIAMLLKPEGLAQRLDAQTSLHSRLRGLPHHPCAVRLEEQHLEGSAPAASQAVELDEQELLRVRLERSVALLAALAAAKQVMVDVQLFDAAMTPLKTFLAQWVGMQEARGLADPTLCLPLELLADAAAAAGAAGIRDAALPALLTRALRASFGEDVASGYHVLSGYQPAETAVLAQFLAYGSGVGASADTAAGLALLWAAALPKLRDAKPHLALMLLDAVVRGGPEELLAAKSLHQAVDELLVQRLDFDASLLGKLGC